MNEVIDFRSAGGGSAPVSTKEHPSMPDTWSKLSVPDDTATTSLVGRFDTSFFGSNECTFKIYSNGDHTIDWGDGIIETFANGTPVRHTYADGVYEVNITGSLKTINASYPISPENTRAAGLHEVHLYGDWVSVSFSSSELAYFYDHGELAMTGGQYMFSYLRSVYVDALLPNLENIDSMFKGTAKSHVEKCTFANATSARYFCINGGEFSSPSATFESVTQAIYMFYNNNYVSLDSASFNSLSLGSRAFQEVKKILLGSWDFPTLEDGTALFRSSSNVTHAQCVSIINSLPDRTGDTEKNLNLQNTAGASLLTDAEKQVATDKNWSLTL